jgi:hypothetical protein
MDVFISYASTDRQKAARLAEILAGEGLSLWWDNDIPPGSTWSDVIEKALNEARCVIVLWSSASISSHWVNAEAREGLRRGILLPVVLDGVTMPLEFRSIQAIDLSPRSDPLQEQELDKLTNAVAAILGKPIPRQNAAPPAAKARQWPPYEASNQALTYLAKFVQLVVGPKAFLAGELENPQRAWKDATLFLLLTYCFGFLLTLPLPSKNPIMDFVVEAAFVLFTVLVFGIAVYVSWRLVGATAPLQMFLTIHFFCAGVLNLVQKTTFVALWGLMRLLSEPAWFAQLKETLFCSADLGSLHPLLAGNARVLPALFLVVFTGVAIGIVWVIAVWGAYRKLNNLSRARSVGAAVIFVPLALLAHGISYLAASALLSPQC